MLLDLKNISLSFGKRKILDNVSFTVSKGEIIAITGKSGTGKTSLLGIISGLLDPDSGEVLYKDENLVKWWDFKKSAFRNRKIGFVFQFFNLLPDLTAYENIRYPSLKLFFPKDVHREIVDISSVLGIDGILQQKPVTLSGGERQRVAIARAVINKPSLLLADEPTGNLDVVTALEIKHLFARLREEKGISIVIITHDQKLIEIADRHYHLEECRLTLVEKKPAAVSVEKKRRASTVKPSGSSGNKKAKDEKTKAVKPGSSKKISGAVSPRVTAKDKAKAKTKVVKKKTL